MVDRATIPKYAAKIHVIKYGSYVIPTLKLAYGTNGLGTYINTSSPKSDDGLNVPDDFLDESGSLKTVH